MIADRIRALRIELHMTQTSFAQAIGLSQGHLTSIETGKRNVTDRTIMVICNTFLVNEVWLRTGEGDHFLSSKRDILMELADIYHLEPTELCMVEAFLELAPRERHCVLRYFELLGNKLDDSYASIRRSLLSRQTLPYASRSGKRIDSNEIKKLDEVE